LKKKSDNILNIENLSIGYTSKKENTVIASDIDIELSEGQLVGLIGINGAGKSTLLRTLSGLQNPLSGNCILDQSPIHGISKTKRCSYGASDF